MPSSVRANQTRYESSLIAPLFITGHLLTISYYCVLTRFRQEPVALMADIDSMFHQVNVCYEDCRALRFLWWPENDLNSEPEGFQMLVHLFGATSSPSSVNFALRKTADDKASEFDDTVTDAVKRNFYMSMTVSNPLETTTNQSRWPVIFASYSLGVDSA